MNRVTYVKSDRDPKTGNPKKLKKEKPKKTSAVTKKVPYEGLAAGYEPNSEVIEAKVDQGLDDEAKEDARNYRKFGTKHNQAGTARFRRALHRSRRGEKKVKGEKVSEAKVDKYYSDKREWDHASEKQQKRNERNNPPKGNTPEFKKFARSVFITQKPGESEQSAATRIRQKAHSERRGVKKPAAESPRKTAAKQAISKALPYDGVQFKGDKKVKNPRLREESEKCDCDCGQVPCIKCGGNHHEEKKQEFKDMRDLPTKVNLVKNKLRAMGLKMDYELEGDMLDETYQLLETVDHATDYFHTMGINEDGLEMIIEEMGLDDFVDFVECLDEHYVLNEERDAKRTTAYNLQRLKGKTLPDALEKEAKRQAKKTGEYAERPKKKTKIGLQAYTTTIVKGKSATEKAKKSQSEKPSVRSKLAKGIMGAIAKQWQAGVDRHERSTGRTIKHDTKRATVHARKAAHKIRQKSKQVKKAAKEVGDVLQDTAKQHAQHRKDFVKGVTPTEKEKKIAGGVGKAVKKAVTREELISISASLLGETKKKNK